MPKSEEFREQLLEVFRVAEGQGQQAVVVNAGDLHRSVGEYPNRDTQRMPVCCGVMRKEMHAGDTVVSEPPKGNGATFTIRYVLPRPSKRRAASHVLIIVFCVLLAGTWVVRSTEGSAAPKEQTYVGVYYCLDSQAVLKQRQAGKQKVSVGYLLPSIDPDSVAVKACVTQGRVPMIGFVEVTPPFAPLSTVNMPTPK